MSNDSNITQLHSSSQVSTTTTDVTLDRVVQLMEEWRANKKNIQEPIPESIWQQVLILLEKFPEPTVRAATGISSTQFRRRLEKRSSSCTTQKKAADIPVNIDFCEVKESNSFQSIPLYKPAKIPATNTLIVEFCRADGRIMKIHTTTDSFAELMKAFFSGE